MLEWPGRCRVCGEAISDWAAAGLAGNRWAHRSCWQEHRQRATAAGRRAPALRSPVERRAQLELPMIVFLLMFHFGLGTAVTGWVLLSQDSTTAGAITLTIGLIAPLVGAIGIAANFLGLRRIELIYQQLEAQGGWRSER